MKLRCVHCQTIFDSSIDHKCPAKPVRLYVKKVEPKLLPSVGELSGSRGGIQAGKFDKQKWQREYMREWRKRDKARKAAKCNES